MVSFVNFCMKAQLLCSGLFLLIYWFRLTSNSWWFWLASESATPSTTLACWVSSFIIRTRRNISASTQLSAISNLTTETLLENLLLHYSSFNTYIKMSRNYNIYKEMALTYYEISWQIHCFLKKYSIILKSILLS